MVVSSVPGNKIVRVMPIPPHLIVYVDIITSVVICQPRFETSRQFEYFQILLVKSSRWNGEAIRRNVECGKRSLFSYPYVAFVVSTGRRIISISTMATAAVIANVMKASR